MSELHISQAFCEHQACPIPTPYEPMANFCWKWAISSFFLYFLRSSYMQPCGWNCPRAEGQGAKKIFCFVHKNMVFHFFPLFFCSWFCMTSPSMWPLWSKCEVFYFFQEILQVPQCWSLESRPPSTKIILAHSYLQTWSWDLSHVCLTWFGSEVQKTQKKKSAEKKFTLKNTQKKDNFDVWM
jgi:hypothetical protein